MPYKFLSTPSARRATAEAAALRPRPPEFLSTPSARRATRHYARNGGRTENFYPRPPRGGRLKSITQWDWTRRFLSTPSARRATEVLVENYSLRYISIHALREEGDAWQSDCGTRSA